MEYSEKNTILIELNNFGTLAKQDLERTKRTIAQGLCKNTNDLLYLSKDKGWVKKKYNFSNT